LAAHGPRMGLSPAPGARAPLEALSDHQQRLRQPDPARNLPPQCRTATPAGRENGPALTFSQLTIGTDMLNEVFSGNLVVVGMGYIGLPTATVLATRGVQVTGVDVNPRIVETISRGEAPFIEPDLAVAVSGAVAMGRLSMSREIPEADAFIIAVPTPFNEDHTADLSYVKTAAEQVAVKLRPGNIVVLESTSPPGTTELVSRWIGAARPDLAMPHVVGANADV